MEQQHLIILGAMKCGTSSLFDYLAIHPEIQGSKVKEPEFFSRHQSHRTVTSDYQDLWGDSTGKRYLMEASTGYTKWPVEEGVAQRMKSAGVRPKFIYAVRNPIDRMNSHIRYIKNTTLNDVDVERNVLSISMYYKQLQPYVELFGRESIHIVDFERLIQEPEPTLAEVFDFLDIAHVFPDSFEVVNKTQKLSSIQKLFRSFSVTQRIVRLFPKSWVKRVKDLLPKPDDYIQHGLSDEEIKGYKKLLEEDIKRFGEEFGFPVNKWGFER